MGTEYTPYVELTGFHVRLEPLDRRHTEGLLAAAMAEPSLYQWSLVPKSAQEMERYVGAALAARDEGNAVPFAIVRQSDEAIIGCTRFFDFERWAWPPEHAPQDRPFDACEIGYTWFTRSAIRTAANTETKLLMLGHAFETWKLLRICFHTDERNERSRVAIERIGGRYEGILRAYRLAADISPRNTVRYSILTEEWPDIKGRFT